MHAIPMWQIIWGNYLFLVVTREWYHQPILPHLQPDRLTGLEQDDELNYLTNLTIFYQIN